MTELYNKNDLRGLRDRITRWRVIDAVIAAAELIVAAFLLLTVNTENESANEVGVIISFAVVAWIIFYTVNFIILASKRELAHADLLRVGARTEYTGRVVTYSGRFRIRKSILVRRFVFETDGGERVSLNIADSATQRFFSSAKDKARIKIATVHGFVAAYGQPDDPGPEKEEPEK